MPAPLAAPGHRPHPTLQAWAWASPLVVPWLVAPQSAPSPSLVPWLVTLVCLVLWTSAAMRACARDPGSGPVCGVGWAASLLAAAALNAVLGLLQAAGWPSGLTGGETQVFGFLRQRNQLATLLNLGLCVLLWSEFATGRWRPLATGLSVLLAVTLAATASRTGLLGLALVLGLRLAFLRRSRGSLPAVLPRGPAPFPAQGSTPGPAPGYVRQAGLRAAILAPAASYVLATLVLFAAHAAGSGNSGLLARWSDASAPCVGRQHIWSNVLELIAERPWTGWGWGELAYAHVMADYHGLRTCEMVDNAHNLPLHLAVTLGLPLTLLLLLATAAVIWRARPWAEADPARQLAWVVLAVIGLHSLLEYPLWYGPFMMTAVIATTRLLPAAATARLQQALAHRGATYHACLGVTALGLAATLYAAWDYHRITQLYLAPDDRSPAYAADPLAAARASWLYRDAVAFAALQLTPLTAASARQVHDDALRALHYSPEPVVLRTLADSAALLGHADEAAAWRSRLQMAYPKEAKGASSEPTAREGASHGAGGAYEGAAAGSAPGSSPVPSAQGAT